MLFQCAEQGGSNLSVCEWNPTATIHLSESYWAVLSCGTACYAEQGGSNFWVCDEIWKKTIEQYFYVVLFTLLNKVIL